VAAWLLYGARAYEKAGLHLRTQILNSPPGAFLHRLWGSGWGMDALYGALLVKPFVALAHWNRRDLIDQGYTLITALVRLGNRAIVLTQTGYLRWYALSLVGGLVFVIGLGVWA